MQLAIKPITTYSSINSFNYNTQWNATSGSPANLYFQIVDSDQSNLRVMGATSVQINFLSVDTEAIVTKTAISAGVLDSSIWYVSINSNDVLSGGNVQVVVVLNGNTYTFIAPQALSLQASGFEVGGC
jgi:hypothetical protein